MVGTFVFPFPSLDTRRGLYVLRQWESRSIDYHSSFLSFSGCFAYSVAGTNPFLALDPSPSE